MALVVVVSALTVATMFLDLPTGDELQAWVAAMGTLAPLVFFLVCALGTPAFLPKPLLATAGGLLFGILPGVAIAVVGFTIGAMISFAIGRKLGRGAMSSWFGGGRLRVLDEVFANRGIAATLVLRTLPVLPFTAVNYGAGVTAVSGRHFAYGTAIGVVPSTLLGVLLGDALKDPGSPRAVITIVVWAALSAAAVWWGRRLLVQAMADEPSRAG